MQTHVRLALVGFVFLISTSSVFADKKVEIFNGKDLKGWTKRGGKATYAVENGEIVGRSAPNSSNTFLCTDKEYGDFILELDFKIDPEKFNSGVQLRSHARKEGDEQRVYGYQVEIDTDPNRPWTGGIYFEGGLKGENGKVKMRGDNGWLNKLDKNEAAQKERHLGEWNHFKIVAKGNHIQTWLNGVPAADYTDKDKKAFAPTGFIALQVHGVGASNETKEVRWKNIKLTKLD
jgi:3-keto-disaccharide hydrolase